MTATFNIRLMLIIVAMQILPFIPVSAEAAPVPLAAPTVGAIRWDAWFAGNLYEHNLNSEQWRGRLPFYSQFNPDGSVSIRADSQEVMDQEISIASEAGLDYWAFCYYRPIGGLERLNEGVTRYLSSPNRDKMHFCLILVGLDSPMSQGEWSRTVKQLVTYFREPTYQKVQNGRPLLYIFDASKLTKWAGSVEAAKAALAQLDAAAAEAGIMEPYLVAQSSTAEEGARSVDLYGLDAIGSYTRPGKGANRELRYRDLADANRRFWEDCKAKAKQVVPIVNTGWDNRPRRSDASNGQMLNGPWYVPPTPGELAIHLYSALLWVRKYPESTDANTILIYAWNEMDEGGWLVPTLQERNARLDAVKAALEMRTYFLTAP